MWYWFSKRNEEEVVEIQSEADETPLTCSELVDFAATTAWDDWAVFLTMARNHKIDEMQQASVIELFDQYKAGNCSTPTATCTPRQLAEFIYLLTPERWETFKQFTTTLDINSLTFTDLLLKFHTFEYEHATTSASAAVPSVQPQLPTNL